MELVGLAGQMGLRSWRTAELNGRPFRLAGTSRQQVGLAWPGLACLGRRQPRQRQDSWLALWASAAAVRVGRRRPLLLQPLTYMIYWIG